MQSLDINPIFAKNNEVLKDIQRSICLSLAKNQPRVTLEPKKIYDFTINPCGAVFFEVPVWGKKPPFLMRCIKDVTETKMLEL